MANLLILENDEKYATKLVKGLEEMGNAATWKNGAEQAEKLIAGSDAVVISSRLPWREVKEFLQACEQMRKPMIFLSEDPQARLHLQMIYHGISAVLLRPCGAKIVGKKAEALLKHAKNDKNRIRLEEESHAALLNGKRIALTAQEYALLRVLLSHANAPVSREVLLRTAWGYRSMGETRTVDVHVQRLRRKLGCARIETIYKTGYRIRTA